MTCNPPISIIHLITSLDVGGAEMMLLKLLSEIDRTHFYNQVVCLTDIGLVGKKMSKIGIPIYALNMPHGRITIYGLFKLWKLLRIIRPTVLQTWLYHADLLGLVFGKLTRVKNIFWNIRCSNMVLNNYRFSTKWTIKLCSLLSVFPQSIVTNSKAAKKFHIDVGYATNSWRVIPNGFDLKLFKPDKKAKGRFLSEIGINKSLKTHFIKERCIVKTQNLEKVFLIGLIARYDPMKNHSNFINAACLLLEHKRNVNFILIGRNITWNNKTIADQIPSVYRNHFYLLEQRFDIDKITPALDIVTSSSAYGEGFPNTIGEAMSCGVPCVVTDVGDSATLVGNTGRVVPPGDSKTLANAWKELIDMRDDQRHELGIAARKRIMDHFEISKIVRKYESLYTSIVLKEIKV